MSQAMQVQDLPRVNQIAAVLAKNGFGHLLGLVGLTSALPSEVEDTTPFARRLRQSLVDLGPTFVKLGQVLSVRPDILPDAVLKEFQTLQDRVQPMPFQDVRDVLEEELQQPLEEVFSEFDDSPLGSASIAQVHRGVLKDGTAVAVKLQRKDIERTIDSDVSILYSLARLLENNGITLPGLYTPTAIIQEFDAAIHQELDFGYELKNCERLRKNFEGVDDIVVPKVVRAWSSRRMLCLEIVEGRPLKEVMEEIEGEEARRLAHLIMEGTFLQVFEHGFFHGDPHPGNLFVTPDGKLCYLDHGIAGVLSSAMQDTIVSAFTSMVFRDAEALAMAVYRAGATKGRIDLKSFIDECQRMMTKYHGASLDDIANRATFVEVVQLCMRFNISLPAEFAVLSRAIALIEGEVRALLPGIDIVAEVTPYARRLMQKRFSPERLAHDLGRAIVIAQAHMKDLPTQMNQVLLDLEAGSITVVTKDPDAPKLREEIRSAVLRLSLAAMASTVSLGSALFLVMAFWHPSWFAAFFFLLVGLTLLGAGGSLFGALGIHVIFAGFFDLKRWRARLLGVLRFFSWRRRRDGNR